MNLLTVVAFLLGTTAQLPASDGLDWHWNRETAVCNLKQTTASGDSIEIGRTPANDQTGVMITSQMTSSIRPGHFERAVVRLSPGAETLADVYARVDDAKQLQIYGITQDPSFMSKFSAASTIELIVDGDASIKLPLRSTAPAADALRRCEDQKMRDWGIDPAAWRSLKSKPSPLKSLMERFSNLDYPREALAYRVEADAVTRLDVGPDGRVKRCQSVNSGEYKGFEKSACDILRGARFEPAHDETGAPISAPYLIDVVFRIAH